MYCECELGFTKEMESLNNKAPVAWSEDQEPVSSWILPRGADWIVREVCAQELLRQVLDGRFLDAPAASSSLPGNDDNEQTTEHEGAAGIEDAIPTARSLSANDFCTVRHLIATYPGICRCRYEFRWEGGDTRYLYPLAMLSLLQPPLELIHLTYEAFPQALTIAEPTKGCIPLHYACSVEGSLELVSFLLDQNPETIRTKRLDGMMPLHLASYFQAPSPIVDYLYEQYPEAIAMVDHEQWTPLHAAARGTASLQVVERLYQWRPESALELDEARRTPLHLACMKRGHFHVVERLYQCEPAALAMQDVHTLTPLFHAAKCQSAQTLQFLLQQLRNAQEQEQQVEQENEPAVEAPRIPQNPERAHIPLPQLQAQQQPPQQQSPQSWLPPSDHLGATVLHFAVAANTPEVVDYLCRAFPPLAEALCTERMRYTALHVACLCDAPVPNVQALLRHYPETLLTRTGQGHDCLHIARKSNVSAQLRDLLEREMTKLRASKESSSSSVERNKKAWKEQRYT